MIIYSVIMFMAAILFLAIGISVYRGNTKLIHDYHQTNIKESQQQEYGRAFAKGMFIISAALLISGIIALFGEGDLILAVSLVVLSVGLIVSIAVLVKVQKKYNGRLF